MKPVMVLLVLVAVMSLASSAWANNGSPAQYAQQFFDSSPMTLGVSNCGGVTYTQQRFAYGSAAGRFPAAGSTSCLTLQSVPAFDPVFHDVTLEAYINMDLLPPINTAWPILAAITPGGYGVNGLVLFVDKSPLGITQITGELIVAGTGYQASANVSLLPSTWYAVAVQSATDGDSYHAQVSIYVNGYKFAQSILPVSVNALPSTGNVTVGFIQGIPAPNNSPIAAFTGTIDDARVSNQMRYVTPAFCYGSECTPVSAYAVPGYSFVPDSHTAMLLHFDLISNLIVDSSPWQNPITVNGPVGVTDNPCVFGCGSGRFAGGYLSYPATGRSFFNYLYPMSQSIDFFLYLAAYPAANTNYAVYTEYSDSNNYGSVLLHANNAGTLSLLLVADTESVMSTAAWFLGYPQPGSWFHLAIVTATVGGMGGFYAPYWDGNPVSGGKKQVVTPMFGYPTGEFRIGSSPYPNTTSLSGFMDEFRQAFYPEMSGSPGSDTSQYPVPRGEYVPDSNTSILLHFGGYNAATTVRNSATLTQVVQYTTTLSETITVTSTTVTLAISNSTVGTSALPTFPTASNVALFTAPLVIMLFFMLLGRSSMGVYGALLALDAAAGWLIWVHQIPIWFGVFTVVMTIVSFVILGHKEEEDKE